MIGAVISGGITLRRMLRVRNAVFAAGAGALTGAVVLGLPTDALVHEVFGGLVTALAAILVLPVTAGLLAGDRRGGYESLAGLRPVSSAVWTLGRALGCVLGSFVLTLLIAFVASAVGGHRPMPVPLDGQSQGGAFRFGLPRGVSGPFDMQVECLFPLGVAGTLDVTIQRGQAVITRSVRVYPARRHVVVVPDLAPAVGDLYVRIEPSAGVVLGATPPSIAIGRAPLGADALPLRRDVVLRLGFALLAVFAAACAFHFETACLAGLLAVLRPPPSPTAWLVIGALLLVFAVVGTALTRRQALP